MIRVLALLLCGTGAAADTVVAAHTVRPQSILTAADLVLTDATTTGGVEDPALLIGMEARVALYAGRPVRLGDVGPPASVERNQIIPLVYRTGRLSITTEGRALDRAAAGEWIRIMNVQSHTTVSAQVSSDGRAYVYP